jgi:hypothetical protein
LPSSASLGDAVRSAEVVEQAAAARAVPRAQRAGRIIDAGVNDLAVARGHAVADAAGRLGDDHVMAAQRRRPGDGKSNYARANDEYLHALSPLHLF